ncbi:MAG: flap endonuclease [Oscillospiraceae bacterium]|nr:flap endonuclease [Oscillospiraceae bacterium]
MFYGMPARIIGRQGRPIQGTLGFIGALLKVVRKLEPTHLAVLFDGETENPRGKLDENYKANREDYSALPEAETPFSQLPDIYAALDHLGICHRETWECETDDWMASYALGLGKTHKMTLMSQDSDYFQLITDKVSVLRYRGDNSVLCDPAYIREKLEIEPEQYGDYKCLTGDASDNIRGADKVGPKTAAQLMRQFGTLQALLNNVDAVTKPSVRESVRKSADRLLLNQKLIRLEGKYAVPFSLEQMLYTYDGQTSTQVLTAIGVK